MTTMSDTASLLAPHASSLLAPQASSLLAPQASLVAPDTTPVELPSPKSAAESLSHGFGHGQANADKALRPQLHKVATLYATVARLS